MEKKINFINIDTRTLPQIAQNRILSITGEVGANFIINIIKYNLYFLFKANLFEFSF